MYWGQKKATLKCAVLSHNTMPQMSQVLRKCAIGMLIAGMFTTAVTREYNVKFFTISRLQPRFREFGSTSNRLHKCRPLVWRWVVERVADVNVVNRVPHGGGGFMVWAGTEHNCICVNAQGYRVKILRPL